MRKKILVTGSGGFIFSNFIRFLLKNSQDFEIVSIDNCSSTGALNTIYSNKHHNLHIGDVTDKNFINTVFELEKPDFVIHGAASDVNSNIIGSYIIAESCNKYKVQKLILISSDQVYGPIDSDSFSENDLTNPITIFSSSKASAELMVKSVFQNTSILRLSNVYGPRQSNGFISKIISSIINNKEVCLNGDGTYQKEWLYVLDACNAIYSVLLSENCSTYNVSSGQEYKDIEVFNIISNIFEKEYDFQNCFLLLSFDKSKNEFRYSSESSKLKKLGWRPDWKFKDGISHTVNWYLNNKWFLK